MRPQVGPANTIHKSSTLTPFKISIVLFPVVVELCDFIGDWLSISESWLRVGAGLDILPGVPLSLTWIPGCFMFPKAGSLIGTIISPCIG